MNNLRAETLLRNVRCEKVFQGAYHFPELAGRHPPVHNSLPNLRAVLTKLTVVFNDKQFDQEQLSQLEKKNRLVISGDRSIYRFRPQMLQHTSTFVSSLPSKLRSC